METVVLQVPAGSFVNVELPPSPLEPVTVGSSPGPKCVAAEPTKAFRPLANLIRERLIDRAVAAGATRAAAEKAIDQVASDRPLIDWLINGGFEQLLKLVMEIIAMFA